MGKKVIHTQSEIFSYTQLESSSCRFYSLYWSQTALTRQKNLETPFPENPSHLRHTVYLRLQRVQGPGKKLSLKLGERYIPANALTCLWLAPISIHLTSLRNSVMSPEAGQKVSLCQFSSSSYEHTRVRHELFSSFRSAQCGAQAILPQNCIHD